MVDDPTPPGDPHDREAEPVKDRPAHPTTGAPPRARRWFRWLWLLLPVLCATLFGVGYLLVALRREPEFYRRSAAALQDAPRRRQAAAEFSARAEEFAVAAEEERAWQIEFTEQQVNAWLWEELPRRLSPHERAVLSQPLVEFGDGSLRLGARVDSDQYRGVLSVELRPRVETEGRLVLDIASIRAGDLPIPAHRWIAEAAHQIEQSDWPVQLEQEPQLRLVVDLRELGAEWSPLRRAQLRITPELFTLLGE